MPYFNMGNTFDYAEMAYLIFPRPFMVERGHHDHVSEDRLVAYEYAKVRWLYVQFGLSDRTQMEYFNGGHTINGQGTFGFLCKHLDWPCPSEHDGKDDRESEIEQVAEARPEIQARDDHAHGRYAKRSPKKRQAVTFTKSWNTTCQNLSILERSKNQ